jgi:UDP-N-acetylglucosamine--N-acetylmuramyl-(pentapeptide) pyrophosphoryl-undecaprenol N-acetylglucosamine transferase
MKFVVSAGGTAGHIYPAIAVALELKKRGHSVVFAGTPTGLEAKLAPSAGIEYVEFEAAGFDRAKKLSLFTSINKIRKSSKLAKKWLKKNHFDVVLGFGGFASVPVGRAANSLGVPLLLHEQNSVCGWANRYLAKHASAIALTYEVGAAQLAARADSASIQITGNPVRHEILNVERIASRLSFKLTDDETFLFIFGGSQGARHINQAIVALAPELSKVDKLKVLHVTGPKEHEKFAQTLDEEAVPYKKIEQDEPIDFSQYDYALSPYFNKMAQGIAASDVIVCRAGATTLAELSAIGAAAILVPFPFATDDHQSTNAKTLVESGAAVLVNDKDLDSDIFREELLLLIEDKERQAHMRSVSKTYGRADALMAIANLAESMVNR